MSVSSMLAKTAAKIIKGKDTPVKDQTVEALGEVSKK